MYAFFTGVFLIWSIVYSFDWYKSRSKKDGFITIISLIAFGLNLIHWINQ